MSLQWPLDYFIHSVSTGSLLLFTFFMISDPKTSPNHPVARIIWAVLIALSHFISPLSNGNTIRPVWVLSGMRSVGAVCWIKSSRQKSFNGKSSPIHPITPLCKNLKI